MNRQLKATLSLLFTFGMGALAQAQLNAIRVSHISASWRFSTGHTANVLSYRASSSVQDRRPFRSIVTKQGNIQASQQRNIANLSGSGAIERINLIFLFSPAQDATNTILTMIVDNRTMTTSLASFCLMNGINDNNKNQYIQTDNLISLGNPGRLTCNRTIHIPYRYGFSLSVGVSTDVTYWENIDYHLGADPIGLYPSTRNTFYMYSSEVASNLIKPYSSFSVLPVASNGPGELDSIFLQLTSPDGASTATLEAPVVLIADGGTIGSSGGEDWACNSFYFQIPTRTNNCGVGRYGSGLVVGSNTPWYVDMYRNYGGAAEHVPFNSSLAVIWTNGIKGHGETPLPINAGANVVYYAQAIPPLISPPGASIVALYKSESITGMRQGAKVTSWPDSSGNRIDLTLGHGAPTYNASDSSLGGHPSVRFHSSSCDVLQNLNASIPTAGTGTDRTIFVVMTQPKIVSNGEVIRMGTISPVNTALDFTEQSSGNINFGGSYQTRPGSLAINTPILAEWALGSSATLMRSSINGSGGSWGSGQNTKAPTHLIAVGGNTKGNGGSSYLGCIDADIALIEVVDGTPNAQGGAAYYANTIEALGYGITDLGSSW